MTAGLLLALAGAAGSAYTDSPALDFLGGGMVVGGLLLLVLHVPVQSPEEDRP